VFIGHPLQPQGSLSFPHSELLISAIDTTLAEKAGDEAVALLL
jgi:hypothetical protein